LEVSFRESYCTYVDRSVESFVPRLCQSSEAEPIIFGHLFAFHIVVAGNIEHHGTRLGEELPPECLLFGRSPAMQELKVRLFRVCTASVPLLLQGEIGVGKATLSRFIHAHFAADKGQYLRVNCAAVADGWAPLAFSVALKGRAAGERHGENHVSSAVTTLVFDRVCALPALAQRGLAQLLVEREEQSPSGRDSLPIRIIAATTRDLRRQVKQGHFRRDLFDLLAVVTVQVPPLRQRMQDLPELCEYLRLRLCARLGVAGTMFPASMMDRILQYHWPGNICELENFIGRFVSLGPENCGPVEAFPSHSFNEAAGSGTDAINGRPKWNN
jgi:DNA-binding NtrC family response regulator